MRIVHCSDWHGAEFCLPEADVYVFSGDMLPNFQPHIIEVEGGGRVFWQPDMERLGEKTKPRPDGVTLRVLLNPDHEARMQTRYLAHRGSGYIRSMLGTPDAPVVVCRGNHDFVDLTPMVAGGPVFEIRHDPSQVFEVAGLKFGGFRGMLKHRGRWSDEISEDEFSRRVAQIPKDLDILVTHTPPCGILDQISDRDKNDPQPLSIGSVSLLRYHLERVDHLRAHLFGHIHESYGTYRALETVYSNAATRYNVIDLD